MEGTPVDATMEAVLRRLEQASGHDRDLDRAIAEIVGNPDACRGRAFTASVDDSRWVVTRMLPGWSCHIGYDARGMFPYAVVTDGAHRCEAAAPTVPLALLRAALRGYAAGLDDQRDRTRIATGSPTAGRSGVPG